MTATSTQEIAALPVEFKLNGMSVVIQNQFYGVVVGNAGSHRHEEMDCSPVCRVPVARRSRHDVLFFPEMLREVFSCSLGDLIRY